MKFTVQKEDLLKALKLSILPRTQYLETLTNTLIETEDRIIKLSSTDLDCCLTQKIKATIAETGKILISTRLLKDFINLLPKGSETTFTQSESTVELTSGRIKAAINLANPDDFPEYRPEKSNTAITVNGNDLKLALKTTLTSVSKDSTRTNLTGIYLNSFNKNLYAVSTDGYRLAEKKICKCPEEVSVLIPANAITSLISLLDDETITIQISDSAVTFFNKDSFVLHTKQLAGSFPDYRGLIPKTDQRIAEATVSIDQLRRAIQLSQLFSKSTLNSAIVLNNKENGTLEVSNLTTEEGQGTSTIEAVNMGLAQVKFNPKYLLDAIDTFDFISTKITGQIKLNFYPNSSPIVIEDPLDPTYLHLVMPLK